MTPADTRTAILDLAEELMRRRSFNAFSYQDIAETIGIRKASIHYHFPSKESLGLAVVERFRHRGVLWASKLVEQGASPIERLRAFFAIQAEMVDGGSMICIQGVLGAELNALPERMRASFLEFIEEQQGWLTRLLAKGQTMGQISQHMSPEELAAVVQSTVQGGIQLARSSGRPERFHAVIRWLEQELFIESTTDHGAADE